MISSKDKTKSIKNLTPKDIKELNFENTMRVVGTFDDFNDKERRTYQWQIAIVFTHLRFLSSQIKNSQLQSLINMNKLQNERIMKEIQNRNNTIKFERQQIINLRYQRDQTIRLLKQKYQNKIDLINFQKQTYENEINSIKLKFQEQIKDYKQTIKFYKKELLAPCYQKTDFLVGVFLACLSLGAAIGQGWKTPDEPGYSGLLSAGIITGIVSVVWLMLAILKIYKACKT